MLTEFDLLRRSQSGLELLAILTLLNKGPSILSMQMELGPPYSILNGPCTKCWLNVREAEHMYCELCLSIMEYKKGVGKYIRNTAVIWGYLNRIPEYFHENMWKTGNKPSGIYIHPPSSFLLMIPKDEIRLFLKELTLRYGDDIQGLLQIFPTSGMKRITMGEALCRAIHYENCYPLDNLRIRFYSNPLQLNRPHIRDSKGMLTFEICEFLDLLEMASIFRSLLTKDQQIDLYEIFTKCEDVRELSFFWGRFYGVIGEKAKDMLSTWDIRQWSQNKFELIYELRDYVAFSKTD
ncbi:MAG: hypothetical protein HQK77_00770 [Desulfobacterales bacterium]|nr:hypothetical protein [Desulfobacterales bacterium]